LCIGSALSVVVVSQAAAAQLAPDEIIRRSVAVNERDWNAGPSFSRLDRTIEKKDDVVTDKTYEIIMMDGSPYRRLVAIDGSPLPPQRQKQEDAKERRELLRRRSEAPDDRQARIRKYQANREQDHLLMTQMAVAFDFRLAGEDTIDGHPVYVLDALPKPDYHPPVRDAKVLTGMKGRLWIDREQFHWAKVEAEVINTVTFGGFIAKVGPGTRFSLENEPVGPDIWEPRQFTEVVVASILFWQHNSSTTERYSDYRRGDVIAGLSAPLLRTFQLQLQGEKVDQVLQGDDRKQAPVVHDHQAAQSGAAHFR
jgi:hypothetical protein